MKSKIVPKEPIPALKTDGCIAYEKELPFPYVHYPSRFGVFFGFQEHKNGSLYHCSCQQKGIELYLMNIDFQRLNGLPLATRNELAQLFINTLKFKDNLCHICNKVCPKYGYSSGKSYGNTKFYSIYGYYIQGQSYSYGIGSWGSIYDPMLIPADIVPYLITNTFEHRKLDEQSIKDFERYCENVIRSRMGYFGIGKKWTTEIKLLEIVKKLYPQYTVIHQYELDHLRGDIYIEELKLVIEYQGKQHFKPMDFMGGEEHLKRTQQRDKEKLELCKYYNIGIIYFSYEDDLTEKLVMDRINSYIMNNPIEEPNK
ncbi:hypothetical protein AB1283_00675 [Bacillus sp. S13(2024)]|uniref:hypothetical protein n=1 Tax=Bacillus sp. S13(2024) TaxID=3162885 RepID=UPI003D1F9E7E